MNSTVRPIFNEKIVKKCNLWVREQCTDALFTVKKSTNAGLKKKKGKTRISAKRGRVTLNPNGTKANIGNGVVMYENGGSEARILKFLYSGFIQVNLYDTYSVLI